jgi:hypothetical protein
MRAACNTAEPFKATRPKGEFFNIIMLKFHHTPNDRLHFEKQLGLPFNILLFIDLSSLVGKFHEIFGLRPWKHQPQITDGSCAAFENASELLYAGAK